MNVNKVGPFKNNILKKTVTQLSKSGALLPVVLLEVAVDSGRAYQAYKRGGKTEMRERMTDDISAGVFWLFGAVWLNKLGDKIGKKFLGIEHPEFSLGKDKARDGLEQAMKANPNVSARRLSLFKLGKVVSSIAIAVGFIGWCLPKINQAITRKLFNKKPCKDNEPTPKIVIDNANKLFEDFNNYRKSEKDNHANSLNPSFNGLMAPETIGKIAHNLENNATWRLGTTDGGILVGRTTNARTFDEGLEYGVRDAISSYFYLWATPHIVALCNKFDKFGGFNTKLDPVSATTVNNYLAEIVKDSKIPVAEFEKMMIGTVDESKFKLLEPLLNEKGNISIPQFMNIISDETGDIGAKAIEMSRLQPLMNGNSILTDKQVRDVLSSGKITEPKFLFDVINGYYGEKVVKGSDWKRRLDGTISDGLKFESSKNIEKLRDNIEGYVRSIIKMAEEQAKKNGTPAEVTMDIIKKASKRNFVRHSAYLTAGLGISALFLSTLIPKFQYWITKKRTGKDGFPGVEELKKKSEKC